MELMNEGVVGADGAPRDTEQLTGFTSNRDQLIFEHMEQVQLIARRIHDRLPQSVPIDDLVSAGILGLISAIDRYDAGQKVKLRTYAEYKIKGAMLDSLRGLDWAPRQHRRRAREIEAAITVLEQEFQRAPVEEEIAHYLGLSIPEYQAWVSEACGLTIGSLDAPRSVDGDERKFTLELADDCMRSPAQIAEKTELESLLSKAIQRMPEPQRAVLNLYYYEELTLRQISRVTGLHESRISQLKSQGIAQLRSHLQVG